MAPPHREEHAEPPIIVKKVHKNHGHGGSWKVAFADFAVAMMAFFLVMWLMGGTSNEERQEIAGYFKHPRDYTPIYDQPRNIVIKPVTPDSSPAVSGNDPISYRAPEEQNENQGLDINMTGAIRVQVTDVPDDKALQQLQDNLKSAIENDPNLAKFSDQIYISSTPEGVRIQIIDNLNSPMFESGSADLSDKAKRILEILAPLIEKVPNPISIMGHTDAQPYLKENFSNWELSTERANAARRVLVRNGFNPNKIAQIVGLGSSVLFYPQDPLSPLNRRISIIILNQATTRILRFQNNTIQVKH